MVTRRLFIEGSLKAAVAAGVTARFSILDLAGQTSTGDRPGRRYDGELIAESYRLAHSLRDGTLEIPSLAPEGPLHDAIVLGAGVSGLMAAWELQRGGLADVVVYEKEGYVGGNARKSEANGTDYTCATWSIARPRDRFLTRLLQDLDVLDGFAPDGSPRIKPAFVGQGPEYNTLIDGVWYSEDDAEGGAGSALARMPISPKDRRDLREFYLELREGSSRRGHDGRPAFAMPVEEASRDPEIRGLDRITMEEYAARKGWGPRARAIIDDWCTGSLGGTSSEVSAYAFLSFESLGQGGEGITLPGGNAWLAERLAGHVGRDRIRTGLMAVRVENHGAEARVVLVDPGTGRFAVRRARSVVIACPKHITGRMVPEMSAGARQGFHRFRYGALLMGAASVMRTPATQGAPLAWYNSSVGSFVQGFLVADYNSARWRKGDPGRPNVLCLWAPLAGKVTRQDLLVEPWSHWADRMADDLESMVPGVANTVSRLDVYVWGHHMVVAYPGFLTGGARTAVTRPLGRITFAHHDRNGMPSFELATRAGYDAAREALALVRGGAA